MRPYSAAIRPARWPDQGNGPVTQRGLPPVCPVGDTGTCGCLPAARIRFGSRPALRGPRRVPAQRTGGFLFDPRRFPDSIFRTGVFYYRNTGKDLRTKFFLMTSWGFFNEYPSKPFYDRSRDESFGYRPQSRASVLRIDQIAAPGQASGLSARKSRRRDNGIKERLGRGQSQAAGLSQPRSQRISASASRGTEKYSAVVGVSRAKSSAT
jgi:hypothetical protein